MCCVNDATPAYGRRVIAALLGVELFSGAISAGIVTTLGWQAYDRNGHAITLAWLGLSEFVPAVLFALPAGHLADRRDRRVVSALGMLGVGVVSGGLAIDAAAGDHDVWPLFVFAALLGAAQSFLGPAFGSLFAAVAPVAELSRVIALSSIAWQTATILGPAVAGLLNSYSNVAPYAAIAVVALLAAGLVMLIPKTLGVAHVDGDGSATLGDALAGIRLIVRNPALVGAITLDLMAVLFGGATALLPIFAKDILHVGAVGNGVLRAAPGVGAVVVGAFLARRPLRGRVGPTLFAVVAGYGLFTVAFGLSKSFAISLIALALLAGFDMVSVVIRSTLGPLLTPPALRGRVGAVERVFIGASNELGAFESGVAASLVGVVPAVVLGGACSIVVAIVWAWRFPELRKVDRFEDIEPAAL